MVDAKTLATGMVVVVTVGLVMNSFLGVALSTQEEEDISEDVLITSGEGQLSWDGGINNFTIAQSLGDAVEFTGASDSRLEGQATVTHDETWTVSTWANADQNRTQRAVQFGGWFMLDLVNNSGTHQWRVTYYDEVDLTVHQVTVEATSPQTWTNVVVTADGSTLEVYENNTSVGSTSLDSASGSVPQNVSNWDGQLEETRVYDDVVTADQRSTLHDTPVAPVKANETARIYFDAWDGETTIDVYRTGADLTLSNASVVDGFAGQSLEEDTLLNSGDYRRDYRTITAVEGGNLDGAPAVFVDYDAAGGRAFNLFRLARMVDSGLSLAALGFIVGAAAILFRLWEDF